MNDVMIRCDDCSAVFIPEHSVKEIDQGIEWTFIMCPRCGARYTITITDDGMRSDLNRIKMLGKTVSTDPKALTKYKRLRERLKKRNTELRAKYNLRR